MLFRRSTIGSGGPILPIHTVVAWWPCTPAKSAVFHIPFTFVLAGQPYPSACSQNRIILCGQQVVLAKFPQLYFRGNHLRFNSLSARNPWTNLAQVIPGSYSPIPCSPSVDGVISNAIPSSSNVLAVLIEFSTGTCLSALGCIRRVGGVVGGTLFCADST
jgi:hypothetical protein